MSVQVQNQGGLLGKVARAAAYTEARSRLAHFMAIRMATTRRLARRGRLAAEELVDDAERRIRREPLRSVGLFFVVGVGVGALIGWLSLRRD